MKDSFHIRHQVRAEYLLAVLQGIGQENLSGESLHQYVRSLGFSPKLLGEHLSWGAKLGLLSNATASNPTLSELGIQTLEVSLRRSSIAYEILHYLHFGSWTSQQPFKHRFSWTYRTLCEEIAGSGAVERNPRQLAEFIIMRAYEHFGFEEPVSVSPNTLLGAIEWMSHLRPEVVDKKQLHVRRVCPVETFLLAVRGYYKESGLRFGEPIVIGDEGRRIICAACLLDLNSFSTMARSAANCYGVLEWASSWGEVLRLKDDFEISSFAA